MLLIVAFVASFSLFGWLVFSTLNDLKVNGHYYRRLVMGKDLVADVLPPPEYMLEEFLVVHQLVDPAYRSYLAGLEQKHEALHRDFEDRHKFWAETLPAATPADREIRQAMLVDAYAPAQRFPVLTFNAATEAARSGEQTRDFSTVAAEIRQSSAESRNLAQGIQALLGRLAEGAGLSVAGKPRQPPAPANVPTDGADHVSEASD